MLTAAEFAREERGNCLVPLQAPTVAAPRGAQCSSTPGIHGLGSPSYTYQSWSERPVAEWPAGVNVTPEIGLRNAATSILGSLITHSGEAAVTSRGHTDSLWRGPGNQSLPLQAARH